MVLREFHAFGENLILLLQGANAVHIILGDIGLDGLHHHGELIGGGARGGVGGFHGAGDLAPDIDFVVKIERNIGGGSERAFAPDRRRDRWVERDLRIKLAFDLARRGAGLGHAGERGLKNRDCF